MRDKVRIAVIGLGFGSDFVPIYRRHPDVARVAICDPNPDRLAQVGDANGIDDRFTDLAGVLADNSWDAVHLLTPVPLHAEQTLAVLNSGRHCACAVPAATSLDDLRNVVMAQAHSGKNYMLMETAIYDRAFLFVRDLLDRGELGNLTFLRGTYYQDLEGGYPKYWRAQPPMHYATHALSPLLALAGTRVEAVCCMGSGRLRPDLQQPGGNTFPVQTALFRLSGTDVVAEVTRSWFQVARSYIEAFSVYGDRRGFEWEQLHEEDPVLFSLERPPATQWGSHVWAERVKPPFRPDLLPFEISEFAGGGHGGSHPHLVNEFIRSIVEERGPAIDAVMAANWTAAGICANDSSLVGGQLVQVHAFGAIDEKPKVIHLESKT